MTHNHMHTREFIIGAAVGSLLGSAAALLAAPMAGKKLRQDICDVYCDLSEKTQDLVHKGKSLAQSAGSQTNYWTGKAKEMMGDARKGIKNSSSEEEEHSARDFLIGGLAGGILGAVVGLLVAPKAGDELRQDLANTYHDMSDKTQAFAQDMNKKGKNFTKSTRSKTNKWLELAKEIVDDLTEDVHDRSEDFVEKAKGLVSNNRIHDVMDWASLGIRLWQGFKSK